MDAFSELDVHELHALEAAVVAGARKIEIRHARRRHLVAGGISVALVVGVAGAAFAVPTLTTPDVAAPVPSTTADEAPRTPTATPTPTAPSEPSQFALTQTASDIVPEPVTGDFDPATTRRVAEDGTVAYFVARGTRSTAPYCLILVPTAGFEGWAAGCGLLTGVRVGGTVVGEAQLSSPGTAPAGWNRIDDFVSSNPAASRTPAETREADEEPEADSYDVGDVQAALDAIGPDVVADYDMTVPDFDPTGWEHNDSREKQTEGLAWEAAFRLGGPVALIRLTYVGLPDDASDSPNSLLWWVTTSEPTDFSHSYVQHVDGRDWAGWGQGDRDLSALQARLSAWLSQNQPDREWTIVTQSQ